MKSLPRPLALAGALVLFLSALTGCETADGGGSGATSVYYGTGFYDPWYYGTYHDHGDIIVTPPPGRPTHPIARPPVAGPRPTPMPSIPSTPRPAMRR